MSRPTFVVDLSRCTGCLTCRIACKDRADLPDEIDWLRIEAREGGAYPTPKLVYRVVHCFHCAQPACVDACPATAIARSRSGLVQVDAALCTGCEACVDACPFGAVGMLPEGVATKCDGCSSEVALGWSPTCVAACPMRALSYFDDRRYVEAEDRSLDDSFDDHGIGPGVVYLA